MPAAVVVERAVVQIVDPQRGRNRRNGIDSPPQ
jgi:hypothetical protein